MGSHTRRLQLYDRLGANVLEQHGNESIGASYSGAQSVRQRNEALKLPLHLITAEGGGQRDGVFTSNHL